MIFFAVAIQKQRTSRPMRPARAPARKCEHKKFRKSVLIFLFRFFLFLFLGLGTMKFQQNRVCISSLKQQNAKSHVLTKIKS